MSARREPGESTRGPAFLFPNLQPRSPVGIERMPALAQALARLGDGKPRGLKRIQAKLLRLALRSSRRLNVPAPGRLALLLPEGPRRFTGDFNNTALIQYARRSAQGGYEPAVTALIDAIAPRLRAVCDVGANWGYYVALLATNASFRGRIDAFEIAPRTFRQLAAMVQACGLGDRVTCHAVGLSDRGGTVGLVEGMHSALTRVDPAGVGREARVIRLDDLGGADPDLVKIDVEGHEAAVLRGGAVRLARAKPVVVLESWYLESAVERMLEPLRWLSDLGYGLYRLVWREEVDGLASYRSQVGRAGPAALALLPLPVEERPLIPAALDVVAVHPDRWSLLAGF
ncbi:MAG TPA: FkbM family methyltransferase [Stellaceae bacterium]|nr:FkbM family methyltransferase [Stellaceae bacterium]